MQVDKQLVYRLAERKVAGVEEKYADHLVYQCYAGTFIVGHIS